MDPQELAQTDASTDRDLTAQVYGKQQILAAPSLYPSIARGGLGCKADLSSRRQLGLTVAFFPADTFKLSALH